MKEGQKLWTREELILAVNLYCKLSFGRLHRLNPEVIHLANLIKRTPSSVEYKLVNFASLDPSLKARGIKGASNARQSLQLYRHQDIDKIEGIHIPNNVSEVKYKSDLTNVKPILPDTISNKNLLFKSI